MPSARPTFNPSISSRAPETQSQSVPYLLPRLCRPLAAFPVKPSAPASRPPPPAPRVRRALPGLTACPASGPLRVLFPLPVEHDSA